MNCQYKKFDQVKVLTYTVSIVEPLKCSNTKDVYEVIYDLKDKKEAILKVIYTNNNNELKNTIDFYLKDKKSYFVEILDYKIEDTKTLLLIKKYKNSDLLNFIENNNLSDNEKLEIINQILEIGCFLHKNSYLHCDIKPENFFIDENHKIRLGDLESLTKLNNIFNDKINSIVGTKGYKYQINNNSYSYSLKDEILAFIATIYFILTKQLLLSKDVIEYLNNNNLTSINDIKEHILQDLELSFSNFNPKIEEILKQSLRNNTTTCCNLQDNFKSIKNIQKNPKKDNHKIPKLKKSSFYSISIIATILLIIFIYFTFFISNSNNTSKDKKPLNKENNISSSTPLCDEAYFLNDEIILVKYKNKYIFYKYLNNKFILKNNTSLLQLFKKQRKKINSNGEKIYCINNHIVITK